MNRRNNKSNKNKSNVNNMSVQLKKDILRAKLRYKKRRHLAIMSILIVALMTIFFRIFLYTNEKREVAKEIENQKVEISNLQKDHEINEVLIDKLNDPDFLVDLIRQEYGLNYEGELIFNLPIRDKFVENVIKSIKEGTLQKDLDNPNRIEEKKIKELIEKEDAKRKKKNSESKKSSSEDETKKNNSSEEKEEKEDTKKISSQSTTTTTKKVNKQNTTNNSSNTTDKKDDSEIEDEE